MKKRNLLTGAIMLSLLGHTSMIYATATTPNDTTVRIIINEQIENAGYEQGNQAYARGQRSMALSEGGIAIGTGAIASGNTLTRSQLIEQQRTYLDILESLQYLNKNRLLELQKLKDLKQQEADSIEAGIRVENINRIKNAAYEDYSQKYNRYIKLENASSSYLREREKKIEELNQRLTAVESLSLSHIETPEGLHAAAEELKKKVEENTTMNLSLPFYEEYITNYYTVLGKLRINEKTYTDQDTLSYVTGGLTMDGQDPVERMKNGVFEEANRFHPGSSNYFKPEAYASSSSVSNYIEHRPTSSARSYYDLGALIVDQYGITRIQSLPGGGVSVGGQTFPRINLDTTVVDQDTYDRWLAFKDPAKKALKEARSRIVDLHFGRIHDLTDGKSTELMNFIADQKFEIMDLHYRAAYYQWKYEQTHERSWLDQKKITLNQIRRLIDSFREDAKNKSIELFGRDISYSVVESITSPLRSRWYKKNILEPQMRNRITLETLTAEMERDLQINKQEVLDRKKELANLYDEYKKQYAFYTSLNPSPSDIQLANEYRTVKENIDSTIQRLQKNQESINIQKEKLRQYELLPSGVASIAKGTDAFAGGDGTVALGWEANILGNNSVGIGSQNTATGSFVTVAGSVNRITGERNTVWGSQNTVYGSENIVLGRQNNLGSAFPEIPINHTAVLGNRVTTQAQNAVILGSDSTGQDNTVSVGSTNHTRKIIWVADGTISATSKEAVNGSQILPLADRNPDLLAPDHIRSWKQKLGIGAIAENNPDTLTGNTVYQALSGKLNTNLSNLSDTGKSTVRRLANEAVHIVNGSNTTVTSTTTDNVTTYAVHVSDASIKAAVLPELQTKADQSHVQKVLGQKADRDAGNLNESDKISWQAALGTGTATLNNIGLITGDTLYRAVGNLQIDPEQATNKADLDTGNLTSQHVSAWQEKLGTGTISAGDIGLVTGDTLYHYLQTNLPDWHTIRTEIHTATAMGAALAGLHPLEYDPANKLSYAASYARAEQANAVALGFFYRPSENLSFHFGSTVGYNENPYYYGMSFRLHRGTAIIKASELAALQAENDRLKAELKEVQTMLQQLLQPTG